MLQKQLWQVLFWLVTLKPSRLFSLSILHWKFILGEWRNQQTNKKNRSNTLRYVIFSLQDDLIRKGWDKSCFNHGVVLGFTESFTRFSWDLMKRPVYLMISTCIALVEKLLCAYSWLKQWNTLDLALCVKVRFCCKNRPWVTCRNVL